MVRIARNLLFASILLAALASCCPALLLAQIPPATTTVITIGPSTQGIVQAGDGNFYAPSDKAIEPCKSDSTMECAFIYQITPA